MDAFLPLSLAVAIVFLSAAVAALLYQWRVNGVPLLLGTRCPGCSGWMKRRYLPRRLRWRLYSCSHCGKQWKREGVPRTWTPFGRADALRLRELLSPGLAEGTLEPVVDVTTCGNLLGAKRATDPKDLVKPVEKRPVFARKRKRVVPPGATMMDRLLRAKNEVHGVPQGQESNNQTAPAPLWDPWIDERPCP